MPFANRGAFYTRQQTERAKHPEGRSEREIEMRIDLLQSPVSRDNRSSESTNVQHGIGYQLAPGKRVADAPINRVRAIFGKPNDIGLRFHSRKLTVESRDASAEYHRPQPRCHIG